MAVLYLKMNVRKLYLLRIPSAIYLHLNTAINRIPKVEKVTSEKLHDNNFNI